MAPAESLSSPSPRVDAASLAAVGASDTVDVPVNIPFEVPVDISVDDLVGIPVDVPVDISVDTSDDLPDAVAAELAATNLKMLTELVEGPASIVAGKNTSSGPPQQSALRPQHHSSLAWFCEHGVIWSSP